MKKSLLYNSGVYRLAWDNSPYFYYGSSRHLRRRFSEHLSLLSRGKHHVSKLQKIYNEFGAPTFQLITPCIKPIAGKIEMEILKVFRKDEYCCNKNCGAPPNERRRIYERMKRTLRNNPEIFITSNLP